MAEVIGKCEPTTLGGLDEVGMGPLAGPVVVVVAVFTEKDAPVDGLDDSKKLTESRRENLFPLIVDAAHDIGWGWVEAADIDHLGIRDAWVEAVHQALAMLDERPAWLTVDGTQQQLGARTRLDVFGGGMVIDMHAKADMDTWQVSAASIVAKVIRDRHMRELHDDHPEYGWDTNKGYGTPAHLRALKQHGLTLENRKTFCEGKKLKKRLATMKVRRPGTGRRL